MTSLAPATLRQRSDYTYKFNAKTPGRHGWLRLTPAYSVRVVEDILETTTGYRRVLDPFCGTATTALSAAYHGADAVTTDINPFLVWFGRVKTARYSKAEIAATRRHCDQAVTLLEDGGGKPLPPPPLHNIERWWDEPSLRFLCKLKAVLRDVAPSDEGGGALLRVAFCRTLIACSNAAFNHQSMSFKDARQSLPGFEIDLGRQFRDDVDTVLHGAAENPDGRAMVVLQDARELSRLETEPFDLVVTSPPYANRMSYIRELRPYMYWLDFLTNGRDAGELDWLAIGGTWGVATSRLCGWAESCVTGLAPEVEELLARIAGSENANGVLLANYVRKYCVDIRQHLSSLRAKLLPGARVHYIVGNSTFYGILLPIEKFYAEILKELGFTEIRVTPIRKRNSKKELVEFNVSARFG